MATFEEKLQILRTTVGQGSNFQLGKSDIAGGVPVGGVQTVRRSLAGILDLLGQLGEAEEEGCGCWESVEDKRGADNPYTVTALDFGKLHVFDWIGGEPGAYVPIQINLPDPADYDPCTRIGIVTMPPVVNIGVVDYVLSNPFLAGQPGPIWVMVASEFGPMMDLNNDLGRIPVVYLGGNPEGPALPYPVWYLLEAVVSQPGEFAVPSGKGWWLKNMDMLTRFILL